MLGFDNEVCRVPFIPNDQVETSREIQLALKLYF